MIMDTTVTVKVKKIECVIIELLQLQIFIAKFGYTATHRIFKLLLFSSLLSSLNSILFSPPFSFPILSFPFLSAPSIPSLFALLLSALLLSSHPFSLRLQLSAFQSTLHYILFLSTDSV